MAKKKEIEKLEFPPEYQVLAGDLSLRCPGFCLLTIKNGSITNVMLSSVNNKTNKKKTHGEILNDIAEEFKRFCPKDGVIYLVREHELLHLKVPSERDVSKVVGIMDWMAYWTNKEWYSIYPVTVKCLIAGSGRATKEEVAKALEYYIGKQEYKCDDESDAAAVAIAWLIQQGQIKQKEKD